MGKIFFLVWLTFNPNHTANLGYMGGHEYASAAACMAAAETFNAVAGAAMEVTTEEELPEQEFNCTTIEPDQTDNVRVVDTEYVADETELFIKVDHMLLK
jgi:hypothetical protein